eukprot:TRINITY_DN560_c0_g1_i2.p1 TRINITY_DN560_c0_g1~~TRINITY_DN560_c0_g1_i2.p1  ORF type:complete len:200 (+),score=68.60 TRINITY_DN560_c0_g1_i2:746-1345(+)
MVPPEEDTAEYSAPFTGGIYDANLCKLDIDLSDAQQWVDNGLSIFGHQGGATPEQLTHLRNALARARAFRRQILFEPSVKYPPIACLVSDSFPTKTSAVMKANPPVKKGETKWDFPDKLQLPGDGRVPVCGTQLPPGIPGKFYYVKSLHENLLKHTEVLESILAEQLRDSPPEEPCRGEPCTTRQARDEGGDTEEEEEE